MIGAALALASDVPAAEADEAPIEAPIEEVTVYAEERVRQARERVVDQLEALGFEHAGMVGDRDVYRHVAPWKGEVVLHDDGWVVVRRQPLRVEGRAMPWTRADTPVAWAGCFVYPWLCVRWGGMLVGTAKWRAAEGRTVERIHSDVEAWGDRIADLQTQRKANQLPDRLEALWEDGIPLDPGPPLATAAERRQALLAYWDSRTETVWGEEVRGVIEAFCRAVVQRSEHPFTDDEIAAFNQTRSAEAPFDLNRDRGPW